MNKMETLMHTPVHDLYWREVDNVLRSMIGAAAVLAAVLTAVLTLSGFTLPQLDIRPREATCSRSMQAMVDSCKLGPFSE